MSGASPKSSFPGPGQSKPTWRKESASVFLQLSPSRATFPAGRFSLVSNAGHDCGPRQSRRRFAHHRRLPQTKIRAPGNGETSRSRRKIARRWRGASDCRSRLLAQSRFPAWRKSSARAISESGNRLRPANARDFSRLREVSPFARSSGFGLGQTAMMRENAGDFGGDRKS